MPPSEGATFEDVMGDIAHELKTLNDRAAVGENVDEEREELEQKAARLEAEKSKGEGESELDRLRREKQDRDEDDHADRLVRAAVKAINDDDQSKRDRLDKLVGEKLARVLGDGEADTIVRRVLASERTPSRHLGEAASVEAVSTMAASGGIVPYGQERSGRVVVSAEKQAGAIMESKNLLHFFSIVKRNSRNEYLADGERQFLVNIQKAALAEGTPAAGGYLVPQEWMPDILGLLRAHAVVRSAGPRFQPFNKAMNQTSVSTGAVAYYAAENAAIPTSDMTFAEAPILTPKNLTGLVPVSNYLLADATGVDSMVRDELTEVIALKEDISFLEGTGAGGSPIGLKNLVGVGVGAIPTGPATANLNGIALTFPQWRKVKGAIRLLNTRGANWHMFMNPALVTYFEGLVDSQGRFLADANLLSYDEATATGVIDGMPFSTTTQIPINVTMGTANNTTYMLLANMSEVIVGINQELSVDVSSEASYTPDAGTTWVSAFQNQQTLFRATLRHDITCRRPSQVIVQAGVLVP